MIWLLLSCSWFASETHRVERTLEVDEQGRVLTDLVDLSADGVIDRRSTYTWQGEHLVEMTLGDEVHRWVWRGDRPQSYRVTASDSVKLRSSFTWEGDRLTDIRSVNGADKHVSHQRFRWADDRLERWLLLDATGRTTQRRTYTWSERQVDWEQDLERGRCTYDAEGRVTLYAYWATPSDVPRQQIRFDYGDGTRTRHQQIDGRETGVVVERYTTDATGSLTRRTSHRGESVLHQADVTIVRPRGGEHAIVPWSDRSAAPLPAQPPIGIPELPNCPAWHRTR